MASWNGFKKIVWEILYTGGPWQFSNLVHQVQAETGFRLYNWTIELQPDPKDDTL